MDASNNNRGGGPTPIPSDPAKAGNVTFTRAGCTTVGLYMPFDHQGQRIEEITIRAFDFDLNVRWREGKFPSALALLAEMCEGIDNETLRCVKYPDMDRVMHAFMNAIPPLVRDDIQTGNIPQVSERPLMPSAADEAQAEHFEAMGEPEQEAPQGTAGTGFEIER